MLKSVFAALAARADVVLSVDTSKPEVITAALRAGAHLVNDIRALRTPGALAAAAAGNAAVCVMHMQGEPATMQADPRYADVVAEVREFLLERASACREAGIAVDSICIDPGIGFGKTYHHNVELLRNQRQSLRQRATSEVPPPPPPTAGSRPPLEGAVGFTPMVLAHAAQCAVTGRAMAAGAQAFLVLFTEPGRSAIVSPEAVPQPSS